MRHGSLFSGIGGFDLAAEWMGWENVFHCEWMQFPRKVLEYYWPDADSHVDICKTDFKKYEGTIDVISGGFPCQPFSSAGKKRGKDDERYLWGEMLRAIQEIKPTWVIAENVFGIVNIDGGLVFEQVCIDLENEGYEVQPFIIPAAAKNAPHRRDRVWFIARINVTNTKRNGQSGQGQNKRPSYTKKDKNGETNRFELLHERSRLSNNWSKFPTQSPVYSGNDGLPTELDGITFPKWRNESIKGYGNAIVPQIAYQIFQIIEHESKNQNT